MKNPLLIKTKIYALAGMIFLYTAGLFFWEDFLLTSIFFFMCACLLVSDRWSLKKVIILLLPIIMWLLLPLSFGFFDDIFIELSYWYYIAYFVILVGVSVLMVFIFEALWEGIPSPLKKFFIIFLLLLNIITILSGFVSLQCSGVYDRFDPSASFNYLDAIQICSVLNRYPSVFFNHIADEFVFVELLFISIILLFTLLRPKFSKFLKGENL